MCLSEQRCQPVLYLPAVERRSEGLRNSFSVDRYIVEVLFVYLLGYAFQDFSCDELAVDEPTVVIGAVTAAEC